ncbi:MAG: hypothetical protein IV107_09985 [Paucibacter sp.]|nr:hypothetical protein [Roseateles sp.]
MSKVKLGKFEPAQADNKASSIAEVITIMIASANPNAASANARAAAPQRPPKAEEVFQQIDSEGKGSVTASDAAAYLVKISPAGARKADAAATAKLQKDIEQSLNKADADGNGELSQTEFKQALSQPPAGGGPAGEAGAGKGAGRPQGPPPGGSGGAGGGGKAGGAGAAGGSSSSSSSSVSGYEKEDANQDGKVTEPERQAYAVEHPKQTNARSASDLALQRYQEVADSTA